MQHLRKLAILATLLTLAVTGAAFAEEAALKRADFPSLDFGPAENAFRASVDITGLAAPMISVTNPSGDRFATVQVVAWSAASGESRWFLLGLEPNGASTLSLEGVDVFNSLSLVSKEAFGAEVLSGENDGRQALNVQRGAERELQNKSTDCNDIWTLTCTSSPTNVACGSDTCGSCEYCGLDPNNQLACLPLGPYSASGRVENGNQVYWSQNTPTGAWTTVGDSSITATWTPVAGCPISVTNSLNHSYSVFIPPTGPCNFWDPTCCTPGDPGCDR